MEPLNLTEQIKVELRALLCDHGVDKPDERCERDIEFRAVRIVKLIKAFIE